MEMEAVAIWWTQVIMIVLFVWAVNCLFWEGMILEKAGDYLEDNLNYWIYKPFIGCVVCMTPWWGNTFGLLVFGDTVLLQSIIAMGINALLIWMKD